ncbi:MAG: DUF58 domain-containing protein [Ardenticatenales bacterium]|nr:DUF58 domain-containing protein [Ardenticatenales bacterium]
MLGYALLGLGLVVGLIGIATGSPLLMRVCYILLAAVGVARFITWGSVRWIGISRTTRARRAEVGGYCEEVFRLTNRGWLPKLWIEVRDESDLPGHRASRVVSTLPPGVMRTWTVRTMCVRRGQFTLGPVTLIGGDPLGLFQAVRHLDATQSFTVYPRTVPLDAVDLPTGYLTGGQVIRRRAQFATTNVRSVRAYQPGDALSRIHWPTTARRNQLFTKEFELDPIADFWIVLDLDRDVHVGEVPADGPDLADWVLRDELLPPTTEEYAVSAAASLARHFLDGGRSVGLVAYGQRRVVHRPDRGERQLHKILSSLAVLRATGRTGLSQVLSTENAEFTRHTTVVVITPAMTLRWTENARTLAMRGVRTLAVLVEPSTFGAAGSSLGIVAELAAMNVPTRLLKNGSDMAGELSGRL